jgi:peptide/nickel transport system substrate-binding protein
MRYTRHQRLSSWRSDFTRQGPVGRGYGIRIAIAVALVGITSVVAAAGAMGGAAAKPVLNISGGNGVDATFNPAAGGGAGFTRLLSYEALMIAKTDGSFAPGLATSWHYLKAKPGSLRANKDYEFTLRHNARFSDGTLVTAQAVKKWFDYFPTANGPQGKFIGPLSSVEAVGKWTVRMHFQSPTPSLESIALSSNGNWGEIASPRCVANPSVMDTHSCGAGPYMIDPNSVVNGDHYTLVPNPYYYDKSKQYWSKIVIKAIPTASSTLQALQAGQIDIAAGDISTSAAAAKAGFAVAKAPDQIYGFTAVDVGGFKAKPLADIRVRQAINYALNRKVLTSAFLGKNGTPTDQFAGADGFNPRYANYYPYNPAKAKSLLAAAGYANGVTIDALTPAFIGTLGGPLVQAVAKQLSAVGITLNLTSATTGGEYVQKAVIDPSPMVWQPVPYNYTTNQIFSIFVKPGGLFNKLGGGWRDRELVKLWVSGSRSADPSSYWKAFAARTVTQADFVPVLIGDSFVYWNAKKLKNVAISSLRGLLPTEWTPAK